MALVARGAKRPRSEMRGLLQAFQPLLLSWSGQNELKTLSKAEWRGGLPLLGGAALLCGFYLNELLLKLLPREDPHARLYATYEAALRDLAAGGDQAPVLRRFELALLAELGYAMPLAREADSGAAIDPEARYHYAFDRGPQRIAGVMAAEPRRGRAAGPRRDADRARAEPFPERGDRGGGEAADARSARPLPRAARHREPPRGAGPAGPRRRTERCA